MQDLTNIYNIAKTYNNSQLRAVIRSGEYKGQTAGLSKNMLQTNLIILEKKNALDFMIFCQRNPKACPLVGVSDVGAPFLKQLLPLLDIDRVRHDRDDDSKCDRNGVPARHARRAHGNRSKLFVLKFEVEGALLRFPPLILRQALNSPERVQGFVAFELPCANTRRDWVFQLRLALFWHSVFGMYVVGRNCGLDKEHPSSQRKQLPANPLPPSL